MGNTKEDNLKFLFDEDMPPRKTLLRLNKRSNVNIRHILHDFKKRGLKDFEVLNIAKRDHRILVSLDWDFKKRMVQENAGIVRISGGPIANEIERRMLSMILKLPKPENYFGKMLTLSSNKVEMVDVSGNKIIVRLAR